MSEATSPAGSAGGAGRAELTFIGTATTLLRLGPFTVLTDPNFLHRGQWAYLGKGLVSRRVTEPALGSTSCRRWTPWSSRTCTATTSTGSPRQGCPETPRWSPPGMRPAG